MFKRTLLLAALAVFAGPTDPAHAGGRNVAVINNGVGGAGGGGFWCEFLTNHGYSCTLFPKEGPTAPLDPFDVVVDISLDWSDPTGMLADFMRAGKTVITVRDAPLSLGVDTNPTVQAWIGANASPLGFNRLRTTASDPILGNIPVGTELGECPGGCSALDDTSGHPGARALARFDNGKGPIGIMRNIWEGGVSVFMAGFMTDEIVLNAMQARTLTIPTVSAWGLLALALSVGIAGAVILRGRRGPRSMVSALLVACVFAAAPAARADVASTQEGGVTYLRLGEAEPFYSTDRILSNLRSVAIPDSAGVAVLWEEIGANGVHGPFYAVSLDGANVDEVRATSYDLQLRYARFDPTTASPAVAGTLAADADGQLYIVQFITQPLSAFRKAVQGRGAAIYNFLPNHAYIARVSTESRAAVAALPFVRAVIPYHPAYRLEEFLRDNLDRAGTLYPLQRYNVQVLEPAQKTLVAEKIKTLGGVVDSPDTGKHLLAATLTPSQLYQVARFDEVLFIDRWGPMEPTMDNVRKTPLRPDGSDGGANYLETVAGYRGVGVRGEVFDCGFNRDHVAFASSQPCQPSNRCPLIVHGGSVSKGNHGASTSGIIFGDGTGDPTGATRGLLPLGQGIVADYDIIGLDPTYPNYSRYTHTGELVDPSLIYQAVFQSTSAGSTSTFIYTTDSYDMDEILFDFDLVHCQAQGNNAGPVSVPQAWAKNTISVGGVEHFNNPYSSDDLWCEDNYVSCGFRAGCTSTGPAPDGRVKPDLVGFHECIDTVSCCDPEIFHSDCDCASCGSTFFTAGFRGTSAATPIVCGQVGLLMEMWADDSDANGRNIFRVPVPSCNPATENCVFKRRPHMTTAKAMLINTATQYDWINGPLPNRDLDRNKQGWGLPNIAAVYDFRDNVLIINENEAEVLTLFHIRSYNFVVDQWDPAFKATLVYADPPGTTSASQHRINDLSLKVISPSGTVYWGNYGLTDPYGETARLWSVADDNPATSEADAFNTVENVFVPYPDPGTWTVRVRAYEINQDGHTETPAGAACTVPEACDADFALVVSSGTSVRGQCCFENPVTCERTVSCASSSACAGPGYTWFSEKTCAEVCELPREGLCCIPNVGICGLASPGCCSGSGGYVVTTCNLCPFE